MQEMCKNKDNRTGCLNQGKSLIYCAESKLGIGTAMKSCKWYINRFSLMSLGEVIHRTKTSFLNSYYTVRRKQFFVSEAKIVSSNWLWEMEESSVLRHGSIADVVNAAELIIQGQDKKDWAESAVFYDICESNRHAYLVTLARAFFVTVDQKYKDEVQMRLQKWLQDNPYNEGMHWRDPLSMAVRLMAWSFIKNLCGSFNPELEKAWHDCIYQHCHSISYNFAAHSSANNHLIGEAAGLFIAATVWPYWKQSAKWQKKRIAYLFKKWKHKLALME